MNLKIKRNTIPLYEVIAEKGAEKDSLCIRCVRPPTEDKMLVFLNKVYSDNNYNRVLSMNEISEEDSSKKHLSPNDDVVFGADYYEVLCKDSNGEGHALCITGVSPPSAEDALECINQSRADCEKMAEVVSVALIEEQLALDRYEMGDWSCPFDIEN